MADISMCQDGKCPKKDSCYRWTAGWFVKKGNGDYQAYGDFEWGKYNEKGNGCDYYWNITKGSDI